MKSVIELLKIIGVSGFTFVLIIFCTTSTHFTCDALTVFGGPNEYELFFEFIKQLGIACAIWLVGFGIYYSIGKRIHLFLYFIVLTTIAFHFPIVKAIKRAPEEDRAIKEVVCAKGSDDGVESRFIDLNFNEYTFINKDNWLPAVPPSTESIDIIYFRDSFLGDFDLTIKISLPPEQDLDTLIYPKWTYNKKVYVYKDFAM